MICKYMGWSYDDLMRAPAHWIPVIIDMINGEGQR